MTTAELPPIFELAREKVLKQGIGLSKEEILQVLQLPDENLQDLLALAHEVRLAWCGEEVEVEGIVSLKTGGCPEDCHFCSQSGLFESPVRAAWLDIPGLVEAAKQTAKTGATNFASSPQSKAQTKTSCPRWKKPSPPSKQKWTFTSPPQWAFSPRNRLTVSRPLASTATTTTWKQPSHSSPAW